MTTEENKKKKKLAERSLKNYGRVVFPGNRLYTMRSIDSSKITGSERTCYFSNKFRPFVIVPDDKIIFTLLSINIVE